LRQDLYRRDFTINTLAVRLGPGDKNSPELIDFFGGRRDLKDKTLRVLHSLSFIDDPTRILRAVRLELRLGFRISPETGRLAEIAVAEGVFDRLSGARLRDELALLLDDPALALPGVERLEELGVLRAIHPRLGLSEEVRGALDRARAACDWYLLEGLSDPPFAVWRLLLLTLAGGLGAAEREQLADRLMLLGEVRRLVVTGRERLAEVVSTLEPAETVSAHRVVEALEALSGEEILALMADAHETLRSWVRRYLGELRAVTLIVRGADLVAAGVAPGPVVGEALRATRRARIDGEISPAEELPFALAHAGSLVSRPAERLGGIVP
jgi:tRNA nucleotidyltransferase (CCA-adding enzyme)